MPQCCGDFRCYVADLAAYNAGRMIGQWIDLDGLTADEIKEAVQAVIDASPFPGAEEYAIHDWDGLPSTFGEWPDWEAVAAYVATMEELGPDDETRAAYRCWLESGSGDAGDVDSFRDAYAGCYHSGAAYAEDSAYELGLLDGTERRWPFYCIDWEAAWRELEMAGDCWGGYVSPHGFFVFRNV